MTYRPPPVDLSSSVFATGRGVFSRSAWFLTKVIFAVWALILVVTYWYIALPVLLVLLAVYLILSARRNPS